MKLGRFFTFLVFLYFTQVSQAADNCVRIYYDIGPNQYWIGRTYALFTQNLLGHFPELQQIVSPINYYQPGDIEKCRATIYIGSHYESQIPEAFYNDYLTTKKNVAWLGYNIWKRADLLAAFGYKYVALTKLDNEHLDVSGKPSFYKWVDYKGERFSKFGDWSRTTPKTFLSSFEMIEMSPIDLVQNQSQVLATCTHNSTQKTIPYILRNKNKFYIADVVYSFMHESDRFLIFSDLLFDILDLPPRHSKKMAVMRMEDIHPMMPIESLYLFSETLKKENVPINVSIIPFYVDPYGYSSKDTADQFVAASEKKAFVAWIEDIKKSNARFIWHGVTHQYQQIKNPYNGITGADFEFWNANQNTAVDKDSPSWVINRIFDGFYELQKLSIKPLIWLTPHYQASTTDNILFGRLFPWSMGRVIYYNFDLLSKPLPRDPKYWFSDLDPAKQKARLNDLSDIQYNITSPWWNGQIFPYEIYGDVHGQRVLPENLGNSQPFMNMHVLKPRSVDEMIADAKRNFVLRDVWASYFYHPFLFSNYNDGSRGQYSGDPSELVHIIRELKKIGYEFIDLEDFAKQNLNLIRPEPIYITENPNEN